MSDSISYGSQIPGYDIELYTARCTGPLKDEIARLQGIISNAPHGSSCDLTKLSQGDRSEGWPTYRILEHKCNCWKSKVGNIPDNNRFYGA